MHAYCDQIQSNGGGGGGGGGSSGASSGNESNSNSNPSTTVTLITPSSTPTGGMCLPEAGKLSASQFDASQQQSQQSHLIHNTSTAGNNDSLNGTYASICHGCKKVISERFLLKVVDQLWHEDCLKCDCCGCRLGEVGSTLYTKANLNLCKRDYLRLFGSTGVCSACSKTIPAFEMVMRAKSNYYHLECFACSRCNQRFCVGDKFYLLDNRILCEYDYEELRHSEVTTINSPSVAPLHMSSVNNRSHPNAITGVGGGGGGPGGPHLSSSSHSMSSMHPASLNHHPHHPMHQQPLLNPDAGPMHPPPPPPPPSSSGHSLMNGGQSNHLTGASVYHTPPHPGHGHSHHHSHHPHHSNGLNDLRSSPSSTGSPVVVSTSSSLPVTPATSSHLTNGSVSIRTNGPINAATTSTGALVATSVTTSTTSVTTNGPISTSTNGTSSGNWCNSLENLKKQTESLKSSLVSTNPSVSSSSSNSSSSSSTPVDAFAAVM